MPSLQYYAVWDEALDLLRTIADEHHLKLIPEVPVLPEPGLQTFDRMNPAVATMLETYPVVQLEGTFTLFPLQFEKRKSGSAAGTYWVSDAVGPRLRLFMPRMRDKELTPGSVGMLDHYFNPSTNTWEPASDEVKQAFKAIVATLKKRLVKHVVRKGDTTWIGERTKQQLDEGKVLLKR